MKTEPTQQSIFIDEALLNGNTHTAWAPFFETLAQDSNTQTFSKVIPAGKSPVIITTTFSEKIKAATDSDAQVVFALAEDREKISEQLKECMDGPKIVLLSHYLPDELEAYLDSGELEYFKTHFVFLPPAVDKKEGLNPDSDDKGRQVGIIYNSSEDYKIENIENNEEGIALEMILPALQNISAISLLDLHELEDPQEAVLEWCKNRKITHILLCLDDPKQAFGAALIGKLHAIPTAAFRRFLFSPYRFAAFGIYPHQNYQPTEIKSQTLRQALQPLTRFLKRKPEHINTPTLSFEISPNEAFGQFMALAQGQEVPQTQMSWLIHSAYRNPISKKDWAIPETLKACGDRPPEKSHFLYTEEGQRNALAFLSAYNQLPMNHSFRKDFKEIYVFVLEEYAGRLLFYLPNRWWLDHFCWCYEQFTDWKDACIRFTERLYALKPNIVDGFGLIATGLTECLERNKKTESQGVTFEEISYLFDKDTLSQRHTWQITRYAFKAKALNAELNSVFPIVQKAYMQNTIIEDLLQPTAEYFEYVGDHEKAQTCLEWEKNEGRLGEAGQNLLKELDPAPSS